MDTSEIKIGLHETIDTFELRCKLIKLLIEKTDFDHKVLKNIDLNLKK